MHEGHHARTSVDAQGGSLLVEALIALAIGAVVATSVHGFHTAAIDAMARATDRRVATWTVVADAELRSVSSVRVEHLAPESGAWTEPDLDAAAAPDAGAGPGEVIRLIGPSAPDRVLTLRRDPDDRGSTTPNVCAMPTEAHRTRRQMTAVHVEPRVTVDRGGAERPPTIVALEGRLAAVRDDGRRRVERWVVDAQGMPVPGVELRAVGPAPATTITSATTGASGCVALEGLAQGDYLVSLVASGYVDSAHVALAERPPTLIGLGTGDDVAVARIAPGSVVRAEIGVPPGALLPNLLSIPSFRWSVLDDDDRIVLRPGEQRTLQPGPRTFVLGVCGAAAAGGSREQLNLEPGMTSVVEVPLASLRLEGTSGYGGATIHMQRAAACLDGTTSRPWLRWTGVVSEGVQLALPADTWALEVRGADGRRLLGPIGVQTGTEPVVLRLVA